MERRYRLAFVFVALALLVMAGCESLSSFRPTNMLPGGQSLPEQWEGE